jgi:hypothetical protein
MSAAVGKDVESICSKCGDVWHVVIAMVETKIAKVECKECHGVHRYKDPKGKKKPAAKPRKRATRKTAAAEPPPPMVQADMSKPIKDYRTTESFEPGERVAHVKFGEGVVQCPAGPGKVQILFGEDLKLLAQSKPEMTLGPARHIPIVEAESEPE